MTLPKFDPEKLTFLIDTREKTPWDFDEIAEALAKDEKPLKFHTEIRGLKTADYSIAGLEEILCVERKSLDDFMGCVGLGRDRFQAELKRMLAYPARCVVIEAPWDLIEAGIYRSKVSPNSATGSIIGWMEMGIPFFFARNALEAGIFAVRFMLRSAIRRYRLLESFFPPDREVHDKT